MEQGILQSLAVPRCRRLDSVVAFMAVMACAVQAVAEVTVETVLTGLRSPSGIAVQPESANAARYAVFLADSGGGRVVMIPSDLPGMNVNAITEFQPTSGANAQSDSLPQVGPLGLWFLDNRRLAVGVGSEDGAQVFLYDFGGRSLPIVAQQAAERVELDDHGEQQKALGAYAVTRTRANNYVPDLLIVSCTASEGGTRLWKIPIRADGLGKPAPFAPAEHDAASHAATAVAVSEQGYVAVAAADSPNDRRSQLAFYDPVAERSVLRVPVDLAAIVGLAYSPRTGNLYAADFGSGDVAPGGVYRIDYAGKAGRPRCEAVKIAEVRRPTAVTFGPEGALYVASLPGSGASEPDTGVLLKLRGEL